MPARVLGDVYAISLGADRVRYMQHVGADASQLSSHIVRVFGDGGAFKSPKALSSVSQWPVDFYAHVLLRAGETLKVWRKVGNAPFDAVPDLTWCICSESERLAETANTWYVWRTGRPHEQVTGRSPLLPSAELGLVMGPPAIVGRIESGHWPLKYPARAA